MEVRISACDAAFDDGFAAWANGSRFGEYRSVVCQDTPGVTHTQGRRLTSRRRRHSRSHDLVRFDDECPGPAPRKRLIDFV